MKALLRNSMVALSAIILLCSVTPKAFCQDNNSYVGEVRYFGFNFCPQGWFATDGRLLPISQFSPLFSLLGTYYGGDGVNTFALPDLRGRFALVTGGSYDAPIHNLGDPGGAETVTLLQSQMPMHNHPLMGVPAPGNTNRVSNTALARPKGDDPDGTDPKMDSYSTVDPTVAMDAKSIGFAGQSQPVGIMPPYLTLTACINWNGVFPPRPD